LVKYKDQPVYAGATCPYSDPQRCLDYYNSQLDSLQNQKSSLTNQLNEEQYKQLSLEGKISYINGQITQTENVIRSLEIEIAAENIQISLLETDIQEKEDSVSLLKQEVNVLEGTVNQRITESYKYSFVGPFEVFLDTKNLSAVLRKTKYLIITRAQDIASLEDYSLKITALKKEEEELSKQKDEVLAKKKEIEKQTEDLAEQNKALTTQKAEKNSLLAESKAREAKYLAQLNTISKSISETEKYFEQVMLQLYNTGKLGSGTQVLAGTVIGIDGHTGCSFGSHLHFAVMKNNSYVNPLNYYTQSGGYLKPGSLTKVPMSSAYITQYFSSSKPHYALDLVSMSAGNQNLDQYTVPYGLCSTVDSILNSRKAQGLDDWNKAYLRGEGAPVYAVANGKVYYYTDSNGAKYAMLVHTSGSLKTFYVHLKY
jgi:peptidoglycan hydrolase CwlO-like protein